jgi:transporter family-2 protein
VNNLYLLLAFATGAAMAAQAIINSQLRFLIGGPIWAAATQFVVGLVALLIAAVVTQQPGPVTAGLAKAPWWIWIGGVIGAAFILVSIVLAAKIGATLTLASIIVGQLTAALVIDHFGLFGGTIVRLSPLRVTGVALLLLGVTLIRWKTS